MHTFSIVPAAGRTSVILLMLLALVLIVVGLAAVTLGTAYRSSRSATFSIDHTGLTLHAEWLYRRSIRKDALQIDAARIVDLDEEPSLKPSRRTMGTGLPGYQGGWFRLANGEKALVYVTSRRAVYLPTTEGFSVVLSVDDPEGFLRALKAS